MPNGSLISLLPIKGAVPTLEGLLEEGGTLLEEVEAGVRPVRRSSSGCGEGFLALFTEGPVSNDIRLDALDLVEVGTDLDC